MGKKSTAPTQKLSQMQEIKPSATKYLNRKTLYYILILAILCVAFYYRVIFGAAHFWEDLVYQEFPHRIFARDCLLSFQFPHWNPYTFSGMPFFAAIHTGVLYPFNLLMSLLPVSNGTFWYLLEMMIVVHVFFCGLSMFIYVRSKKLSHQASLFAAISYMLCGFFVTHIIHSLMLYILAWLPLIVLFLEKGILKNKIHYLVIAGVILGITIFAGHPQITFYEYLFLGSYCLYLWFSKTERKIKPFFYMALPFVVATGIAMIQLLPTLIIGDNSSRVGWTFEQASEGSFSFVQIITFLIPKVFGGWASPDTQVPRFWLQGPTNGYFSYWDTCFYTGAMIFLFALFQFKDIKKKPFLKFAAFWCIASLTVALGSHFFVYKILFNYAPGFSRFRSPARILFTWNFLLPLIAAFTFDQINRENIEKSKKPIFIGLGICAALGLIVGFGFFKTVWSAELQNKHIADYTSLQGIILFVTIVFITVPLFLLLKGKISINLTKSLLIGVLVLDLFVYGFNHHVSKGSNAARFFNENKKVSQGIKKDGKSEIFRFNSRQFRFEADSMIVHQTGLRIQKRNGGMVEKIFLLEGYNPLNLLRRIPPMPGKHFDAFLDLLNVKYFINPQYGEASKNLILLNSDKLPRAKMFYRTKVFGNDSLVKDFMLKNYFDHKNTLLLSEKTALLLPQSYASVVNKVDITEYKNNSIKLNVTTEENGLLWLSEVWYPSWKAIVDGKRVDILKADFSFRAIEIPKGNHSVEFVYSCGSFNIGLLITLLSLLGSCGYLIFICFKKSRFALKS